MTYEEIQKAVNEISKMLTDRGVGHYSCSMNVRADEQPMFIVSSYEKFFDGQDYLISKGDTPKEIFDAVTKMVRSLPNKEERNKQAFMAELASVIDKGKDLGIDVEFLNPLVEQMRSLSENIITDKRGQ